MSRAGPRVVVAGLGAMGSAAAAALSRRGASVLALDPRGPGHREGSSHGESRIIRQAYFEDPAYVPLVQRAYRLWRELEADCGERLLELTSGVMVGTPTSVLVQGALASARRWQLPHRVLEAKDVQREFPALRPSPDQVGLVEPEAGVLAPELGVLCLLRQAAGHGAELHFGERLLGWEESRDGVSVRTDRSALAADLLVLCCGAWSGSLVGPSGPPLSVERQVAVWFRPQNVADFCAPRCPVYIAESSRGEFFYGIPSRDRQTAKAAQHHGGRTATAETVEREVSGADLESLREGLAGIAPDLASAPVDRASVCLYTNTPDQNFLIGRYPGAGSVLLAAGFSGHGFKFAPVVGEVLADLALLGSTEQPIGVFDPGRFEVTRAATGEPPGPVPVPPPARP